MVHIKIDTSVNANEDLSAYIFLESNYAFSNILPIIKNLPFRFYHLEFKCWEIPISKLNDFKQTIEKYDCGVEIDGEIEDYTNNDVNIQYETKPYDYQAKGVEYGLNKNRWLLGDEPGLGKTKQVIDIAVNRKLKGEINHCLIICCVNGLKWNWEKEIKIHSKEKSMIIGQKIKNGNKVIGSTSDKLKHLSDLLEGKKKLPLFLITNIETLRSQDASNLLKKCCDKGLISMIAVDEAHKCKNPTSQQSKGLLKLKPEYRIMMTGTPILNSPIDTYFPLKWLGYENHSLYSFKNHHCQMGGFGNYQIVGYKNLDELSSKVNEIMLRRLKSDVLDLPDKIFIDEIVEMSKAQSNIYSEIEFDLRNQVDLIAESPTPLSALIRLRQATGHTSILSSSISESAKFERLEELVEETVLNNDKCIIFSNWTKITDIAKKHLRKYNPAVITGEVKDEERKNQENKFMTDQNCKVAIGTIGAMGTGLTLTAAHTVIFLDEPWTKGDLNQAIDRVHRIGTDMPVTIYTLMCKDTIDERVHSIVKAKGIMSDTLIDSKLPENKTELINYLLNNN